MKRRAELCKKQNNHSKIKKNLLSLCLRRENRSSLSRLLDLIAVITRWLIGSRSRKPYFSICSIVSTLDTLNIHNNLFCKSWKLDFRNADDDQPKPLWAIFTRGSCILTFLATHANILRNSFSFKSPMADKWSDLSRWSVFYTKKKLVCAVGDYIKNECVEDKRYWL